MQDGLMLGIHHQFVGGLIGLLFGGWLVILGKPSVIVVACIIFSIYFACLPDLIDPPTNPFHRSIGHNFISLILFGFVFLVAISLAILFRWWPFILIASVSLSYLSHLFLDMITPMGLPLFVGKSVGGLFTIPLFLVPWVNLILLVITIFYTFKSIVSLSKKIGGKLALLLVLIPLWSTFLLVGIALYTIDWLKWLGTFMFLLCIFSLMLIYIFGNKIDAQLHKKNTSA